MRQEKSEGDHEKVVQALTSWFESLTLYGGFPAKGTISGSLVVVGRLKEQFSLEIDDYTAKGGAQIRGASGEAVKRILAEFGETRQFVSEGGRTNRGLRGDIMRLLQHLKETPLASLPAEERLPILDDCQCFLVEQVREFHNRQRLKFVYDRNRSTRQCIMDLLTAARVNGKEGPVAQYLIGAKLQLRFPDKEIEN